MNILSQLPAPYENWQVVSPGFSDKEKALEAQAKFFNGQTTIVVHNREDGMWYIAAQQ